MTLVLNVCAGYRPCARAVQRVAVGFWPAGYGGPGV